jgi:glycosyltransferase involved in cell wall biosynthesis
MKVGISISTYYKNEETFEQLKATLNSVYAQTYKNFIIYLTGDKFEPVSKWDEIIKEFDSDKLKHTNLKYAAERDNYKGKELWWTGSTHATNLALERMQNDSIDVYARLDHDDIWSPNHLQLIVDAYNEFPEAVFIYTSAKRFNENFPSLDYKKEYNNLMPRSGGLVHSSVTWKLKEMPLNYTDTVKEKIFGPGDAYQWTKITKYLKENKLKALYLPEPSVLFTKKEK